MNILLKHGTIALRTKQDRMNRLARPVLLLCMAAASMYKSE